jgi:hypothetical protein
MMGDAQTRPASASQRNATVASAEPGCAYCPGPHAAHSS